MAWHEGDPATASLEGPLTSIGMRETLSQHTSLEGPLTSIILLLGVLDVG